MSEKNEVALEDISGKYKRLAIKPDQLPPEYVKIRDFHRNNDEDEWIEGRDSPIYIMLSDCSKIHYQWGVKAEDKTLSKIAEDYAGLEVDFMLVREIANKVARELKEDGEV